MAKRGRRNRKFRKYLKGVIENDLDLGTLGPKTLVSGIVDDSVTENAWLSSVKLSWSLSDFTLGDGIGPILCGIAHSDYADSEIEAFVEQTSSWEVGDEIAQEIAKRKIRRVGVFPMTTSVPDAVLNDGKPITTKCGWMLHSTQTIRLWAYNKGTGALATTAPVLGASGHANLWPTG